MPLQFMSALFHDAWWKHSRNRFRKTIKHTDQFYIMSITDTWNLKKA